MLNHLLYFFLGPGSPRLELSENFFLGVLFRGYCVMRRAIEERYFSPHVLASFVLPLDIENLLASEIRAAVFFTLESPVVLIVVFEYVGASIQAYVFWPLCWLF